MKRIQSPHSKNYTHKDSELSITLVPEIVERFTLSAAGSLLRDGIPLIGGCAGKHVYSKVYITRQEGVYNVMLHRLVMFIKLGYFPIVVDHIDGDISNNNVNNLRESTALLNARNKKHHRQTGICGVREKKHGILVRYFAATTIRGILYSSREFNSKELALDEYTHLCSYVSENNTDTENTNSYNRYRELRYKDAFRGLKLQSSSCGYHTNKLFNGKSFSVSAPYSKIEELCAFRSKVESATHDQAIALFSEFREKGV
jgi:hypothetical protein